MIIWQIILEFGVPTFLELGLHLQDRTAFWYCCPTFLLSICHDYACVLSHYLCCGLSGGHLREFHAA